MDNSSLRSKHSVASKATSIAESALSLELRKKRFGSLLEISDELIVALALKIRNQVSAKQYRPSPKHQIISRLNGSYNLVYIVEFDDGLKYVVRIPGTGWGDRFTDAARKSFESQIMTMRLVHDQSTVPVPKIYAFDASLNNELGAPWMVMSFIPGSTVAELWFDENGPTPLEERRRRALESIAKAMSKLQKFQFRKIGSLELTNQTRRHDKITIGPIYEYNNGDRTDDDFGEVIKVKQTEPFNTSMSYMLREYPSEEKLREDDPSHWGLAAYEVNTMMLSHLPESSLRPYLTGRPETFALGLPDFDSQNIMIDEKGNLTGLIDWDNAQTYPRFFAYSRYPSFITRDWDPLAYSYPDSDRENSPEELTQYRETYRRKMVQMLGGEEKAIFTAKSHIFEALWIACCNNEHRLEIMRKAVQEALPDMDALDVLYEIGHDELEPEVMERLGKGIEELVSIKRPKRSCSWPSLFRRVASMFYRC